MSGAFLHISEQAIDLRRAFDRSFAEPQHVEPVAMEDFLAIHACGDPYALRLADVAGLHVDKKITSLPSAVGELRGVAGFRGRMLAVYDLAALLGYPRAEAPRWLVVAAERPVAFSFDSFDGHLRLPRSSIAARAGTQAREHISQIVRTHDGARSIVHLPSIIAAIGRHGSDTAPKKEP